VRLIQRLDHNRRVTTVPYQRHGVPESVGLTAEGCRRAAWAVSQQQGHEDDLYRGAAAINLAVSVALGTALPYRVYALPGVWRLQDLAYDWVAANRGRLPADTPYCTQYPEECR
jgi:predicted DCC family thiol-disulfide oxidoreductase YuxK